MHRIAILADIHGNRWALEAVLADMDCRGIRSAVNLGDVFYGPLDPAGTAQLLRGLKWPTVQGNEDRLLLEASKGSGDRRFDHALRELDSEDLAWLAALPRTRTINENVCLVHGTPRSDHEYLLEFASKGMGVRTRANDAIEGRLAGVTAPVILCAHSHLPSTRTLPSGRFIVNPGSVGLPAYWDDVPCSHVVEVGSPHARYAVLTRTDEGWGAEHITVVYDWNRAARAARAHGRGDWATWLATGHVATP